MSAVKQASHKYLGRTRVGCTSWKLGENCSSVFLPKLAWDLLQGACVCGHNCIFIFILQVTYKQCLGTSTALPARALIHKNADAHLS